MLDGYAAACVRVAMASDSTAGSGGQAHAQQLSAMEAWSLLRLDSARLETLLGALPPSPDGQVRLQTRSK